tara:strand:+ start:752 stop:958 length:207 start_codon:yes stop_codon:yes gene_type:complete
MTEQEINQKIATLQKEKDYYLDLAKKTASTLEQAKTLAFSCQEKIAVLEEFLPKKEENLEKTEVIQDA